MSTLSASEKQILAKVEQVQARTPKCHNEEFLAYNSAVPEDPAPPGFLSKINKTKFARKSQNQFLRDCCDIVGKIGRGGIQPINYGGDTQQDYFIFSDLFISKAKSNADNWRIPPNESEVTTFSVVNTELRNLQRVLKAELNDVNLINTVLVDRLGQRFVLQNLLEGMLYFNPETWGKYGTFDEGKTFAADPDFGKIMKKLCQTFWIAEGNRFESGEGKTPVEIDGSPEVKGIRAGDGRSYIMDLLRMSPRDVNFKDETEHQSCLLRPELVKNYQMVQSWRKMLEEKSKKIKKQKEDEQRKKEESTEANTKEDIPKETEKVEDTEATEKESKIEKFTVNPALFTQIKTSNDESKDKTDEENLNKLAEYLKKEALPGVLAELSEHSGRFSVLDSETLTRTLHKNGVNTRYLGHLLDIVLTKSDSKEKQNPLQPKQDYEWIQKMLSFVILVRSFIKTVREYVDQFDQENSMEVILHCLNLFLGDEGVRKEIQKKHGMEETQSSEAKEEETPEKKEIREKESTNSNRKKNKRKKKKKNKKKQALPEVFNEVPCFQSTWFQLSKPEINMQKTFKSINYQILSKRILAIAQKKYSFSRNDLPMDLVSDPHEKLRFLREVFTKLALKINPDRKISFKLENCLEKGAFQNPLKLRDIADVGFRVKGVEHLVDELHYNIMATDKDFKSGNVPKAVSTLEMYLPVLINIYGVFHMEIVKALVRLGTYYVHLKQYKKAVSHQGLAYLICLKVNGAQDISSANTLTHLSNSFFYLEDFSTSLRLIQFSLKTWDLVGGRLNPQSLNCLSEMQRHALKLKDFALLEQILWELKARNSELYGKADERNLNWLAQLARLNASRGKFQVAVDLQTRHSFILRQLVRKYQIPEGAEVREDSEGGSQEKKKMSYLEYCRTTLQKKFEESESIKNLYKTKLDQA